MAGILSKDRYTCSFCWKWNESLYDNTSQAKGGFVIDDRLELKHVRQSASSTAVYSFCYISYNSLT